MKISLQLINLQEKVELQRYQSNYLILIKNSINMSKVGLQQVPVMQLRFLNSIAMIISNKKLVEMQQDILGMQTIQTEKIMK